jgi:hypothetical protein
MHNVAVGGGYGISFLSSQYLMHVGHKIQLLSGQGTQSTPGFIRLEDMTICVILNSFRFYIYIYIYMVDPILSNLHVVYMSNDLCTTLI